MSNGILPTGAPADTTPGGGPGSRFAPKVYIMGFGALLTATVLLVFYLLLVLWPQPTPSTLPSGTEAPIPPAQTNTPQPGTSAADSAGNDTVRVQITVDTAAGGPDDSIAPPQEADTPLRQSAAGRVNGTAGTSQACQNCNACRVRLEQAWTRKDKPAPAACVRAFGREFLLWDEQRLLLLVLLGGALGGLLHVLRSFGWYVGNRELVMSWLPRYVLLITTGAGLAFVFYVVVRGGFFSPGTSFENTSPFGFIAFATLVGLFSEQAILKLKEISEVLLSKPAKGSDAAPQGTSPNTTATDAAAGTARLKIASVIPVRDPQGAVTHVFTIQGTGFTAQSEVLVNNARVNSTFVSATELTFDLGTVPAVGAVLKAQVRNPDGTEAALDHTVPPPAAG
jgi:hypothetical protein